MVLEMLLKYLTGVILELLLIVINEYLNQGKFHDALTISKMKPMYKKGERGNEISLIESYLTNRQQVVEFEGDIISSQCTVNVGVPERSILGPFLMIAVSDLSAAITEKINPFADNTAVLKVINHDFDISNTEFYVKVVSS